jgi:ATP-dependent RNA helicase DDX18/HAS1
LERLVEKNYYLHKSARDAYRSYLLAYASHSHKHIFDVHALDLQKVCAFPPPRFAFPSPFPHRGRLRRHCQVAKSFGFTVPPKVNLNVSAKGTRVTRKGFGGGWAKQGGAGRGGGASKGGPRPGGSHQFSAQNPYGKRADGDKRQFVKF